MATTTRVEQKGRKVKRTMYSVTVATANGKVTAHKGRVPRAQKKVYPVGKGYGPYAKKTTVAGEAVLPTQTHVPASAATGVSRTANMVVTWSESMKPTAISIEMTGPSGPVDGTLTYVDATKIATFDPTATLAANTVYTVVISGSDLFGNRSGINTFNITTGA